LQGFHGGDDLLAVGVVDQAADKQRVAAACVQVGNAARFVERFLKAVGERQARALLRFQAHQGQAHFLECLHILLAACFAGGGIVILGHDSREAALPIMH
jgi:hypothetical protein